MLIDELIEKLIQLRDEHGSDVNVYKCKRSVCDGSIQYIPIKDIRVVDSTMDDDAKNMLIF